VLVKILSEFAKIIMPESLKKKNYNFFFKKKNKNILKFFYKIQRENLIKGCN
jgi:hypothetical protein